LKFGAKGKFDKNGSFEHFDIPTEKAGPVGICPGPDDEIWVVEILGNIIGKINSLNDIVEFEIPIPNAKPHAIAYQTGDQLWCTEWAANKIACITKKGIS